MDGDCGKMGAHLLYFFPISYSILDKSTGNISTWSEETIRSIGDDLGVFEEAEITSSSVRMRVQVNGRLPLMMETIIEYSNGE